MEKITLQNGKGIFSRYLHEGNLTPFEALNLTIKLIDILSETNCDEYFLKLISRFLTRQSYEELITERNINCLCGYPLCDKPPGRIRDVYSEGSKISQSMMPYSYLQSYCCKRHYQCSEFYMTQLSDEAIFARENIGTVEFGKMNKYEGGIKLLEEILSSKDSFNDLVNQIDNLNLNKNEIAMDELLADIKIIENEINEKPVEPFKNIENLNDLEKYEYLQDQSKAIDGYILR